MTLKKRLAALLVNLALLGCQQADPLAAPKTPVEEALANLAETVKTDGGVYRHEPSHCDEGEPGRPALLCYASLMQPNGAGAERKTGLSTFLCEVKPGGRCDFASEADRKKLSAPAPASDRTCNEPLRLAQALTLNDVGFAEVADYTTGGGPGAQWASVSVTLQDDSVRLTEAQARGALDQVAERLARTCRPALTKSRIFLYPKGVVAGESATWIARLNHKGGRTVDLNRGLLMDERGDRYACLDEKEPGIDLASGTRLPPVRQRDIIGTWIGTNPRLTLNLERVQGKVYRVYRSAYCASGNRGELLQTRSKGRYAVQDSHAGDYYQETLSGDLGVFDREGRINVMLKHIALYPQATGR